MSKKKRATAATSDRITAAVAVADRERLPATPGRGRIISLLPGLVALAALIAFAPCLGNGFVNLDDAFNILTNEGFRGLGRAQLVWAWTTFHLGVYQPLSWMLLEFEYTLWGLNPWGYHLTSLVLYAVVSVVLYAVTVKLLIRSRATGEEHNPWPAHLGSALAVALFVVHPLRTEVVGWVSCQPYLPCALFSLLAVLTYERAHPAEGPTRVGWAVGAFLLFAAALLSKALAVTLPVVLLILDVYPLRRIGRGGWRGVFSDPASRWALLEKLPYIALSIVFMKLAVLARRDFMNVILTEFAQDSLGMSLSIACYGVWFYLGKTLWPTGISAYVPLPPGIDPFALQFLLSAVALVGLTLGLLVVARSWPALLAAWLGYLVILGPNSGLMRTSGQIGADRYSFMATMGLAMLAAAGLAQLLARRLWIPRVVAAVLLGVAGLTCLSWIQCRYWHDSVALWKHALACAATPDPILNSFMGEAFFEREDYQASADSYARAVELSPEYAPARNKLGMALLRLGRLDEAEPYLAEAARLDPRLGSGPLFHAEALASYGELLLRKGRPAEAEPRIAKAVELDPRQPKYRGTYGSVLLRLEKRDEAASQFREAVRLAPENGDFQSNLGIVLAQQGKLDEALSLFEEAVRQHPEHLGAHMNLGLALLQRGKLDEAEAQFREVLRQQPGADAARNALAAVALKRSQGGGVSSPPGPSPGAGPGPGSPP